MSPRTCAVCGKDLGDPQAPGAIPIAVAAWPAADRPLGPCCCYRCLATLACRDAAAVLVRVQNLEHEARHLRAATLAAERRAHDAEDLGVLLHAHLTQLRAMYPERLDPLLAALEALPGIRRALAIADTDTLDPIEEN